MNQLDIDQADEICRTYLPFHIYIKLNDDDKISVSKGFMMFMSTMINKIEQLGCEIKINFEIHKK